jgi:hypothetical protein
MKFCAECLAALRAEDAEYRAMKRKAGLCIRCKRLVEPGKSMCRLHLDKDNEKHRRRIRK